MNRRVFMSKRPSLKKQVIDMLNLLICYGQSKYEAKQIKILAAIAAGITNWNPARVDGIYSIGSMKTYRTACIRFTEWVKDKYHCRWLHEAYYHVEEYIQFLVDNGYSAWTIHVVRPALRKLYQDPDLASSIKLPKRKKSDIRRSRGPKEMDRKFSVERNQILVDFSKAVGLRRCEMQALRVENVYHDGHRLWVHVERGKGGRSRNVPVLRSMESRVLEIIANREQSEPIFPRIPVRADIHGYRREYANSLYVELAGRSYSLRSKDKPVMLQVSWALGHNRLNVVSRSYLGF
jgi:integrase